MISKIIKYLGLLIIVSFCTISIFFAIAQREIEDPEFKKLISYTSFFEDRFYDFRMNMTLDQNTVNNKLALAAIDDYSIKKIGKWPLPRENWATMVDKLRIFGAKVVAFDVFFSEDSVSCGAVKPEQRMADSFRKFQEIPGNKVIVPYSMSPVNQDAYEEVPDKMYDFIMDTKQKEDQNLRVNYIEKKVFPIPLLVDTDSSLAHIETEADGDGIFRHYQVVGNVDTLYFPSFSLATYQHMTGDKPILEMMNVGEAKLKLKSGDISLNYKGEAKIRWFGGMGQFPEVPIWDILSAADDDPGMREIFEGTAVFVGSTAFGVHDLRHSPVDSMLPGVYIHMNMTDMLMKGRFFIPEAESTLYSWGILIIGTILILLVQFFGNALFDLAAVSAITVGFFLYDTYYLLPQGYEIKLFFCLLSVVSCYSWNTFLHFYLTSKDKNFLKSAFGNYISPELIDEMYKSGDAPSLGGEQGVRTAYFTDIQGFSSFSEKLSPTQLVELLNEYLTVMTDILLEERGTLDKYEGDAIIAFFGAPMELIDHAARSCMVAHRMQEALLVLREKWVSENDKWPEIVKEMRMRIGINSGEMVTGNMGSASRMNYTMMGDTVNLAARLEESAKQYGIFTQASKQTVDLAGDQFLWREVDSIRVVGKSEAVTTYDLLGLNSTAPEHLKELATKFKEGINLYKEQKWDEAIAIFNETIEFEHIRFPALKGVKTNPSEVYINRCQDYKELPPPPDWDGVFTLTSK